MFGMENPEAFAQGQVAMYEQFLSALQAQILAIKASGTDASPQLIAQAERNFGLRYQNTIDWMETQRQAYANELMKRLENADTDNLFPLFSAGWMMGARADVDYALDVAKAANYHTFISGLRFGSAFNGLSYLLDDMHGSIGYLVQKKAQKVNWNVRGKDGRTIKTLKYLYPFFRLWAERLERAIHVVTNYKKDSKVRIVSPEGETLWTGLVTELASERVADEFFGFGSKNGIV